jgi:diacylglycerol kinase family enzyme
VLEVLRLRARSFPIRLDEGPSDTRPADFLSFSNSRCTGGHMQMAPHADVADGRLDVIRVGDLGRVGLLRAFPSIYQGTHVQHPNIESIQAAQVTLDLAESVDVMVDGEVLRAHLTELRVLPQALEVFA